MHASLSKKESSQCNQTNLKPLSDSACGLHPSGDSSGVALGGPSIFMKWFKHESSACKDEVVRKLIDSHGIEAYGIYMILLELCAEKIDRSLNPSVSCGWSFIEYLTRSRRSTVRRVIATCASLGLLVDQSSDSEMVCSIPNLLKRLDNWTKDLEVASKKLPLEQEEEEEQEEEQDILCDSSFETFWSTYPKRNGILRGKQKALVLFKQVAKNGGIKDLLLACENYAASKQASEGYARDPERFLKAGWWMDWIRPEVTKEDEEKNRRWEKSMGVKV